HGHKDCKYYVVPKTRTQWWLDKINRNKENDAKHVTALTDLDWNTITIWECGLKPTKREQSLKKLLSLLKK
ncbi:MAG: very short patch repair endonuclease, partial [Flavobacteriales bacterium]